MTAQARSHKEARTSLADEQVELEALDRMRRHAIRLRDGGLRAIYDFNEGTAQGRAMDVDGQWERSKSSITRMLVWRAVMRAANLGSQKTPLQQFQWPSVETPITFDPAPAPENVIRIFHDPLSVLNAATYVRSRLDDLRIQGSDKFHLPH